MRADPFPPLMIIFRRRSQNRSRLPHVSSGHVSSRNQEIVMVSPHNAPWTTVCAAASSLAALSWSAAAVAA